MCESQTEPNTFLFSFVLLGIDVRVSHKLGKCSITEVHPMVFHTKLLLRKKGCGGGGGGGGRIRLEGNEAGRD